MELHKIKLTRWIVMAMLAGAVVGLTLPNLWSSRSIGDWTGEARCSESADFEHGFVADYIINGFFQFLSEAFIHQFESLGGPACVRFSGVRHGGHG